MVALLHTACVGGLSAPAETIPLDEPYFRCQVQPVVTASCAMLACHGDGRRFFRVFARNRLRLGGREADRNRPMSPEERQRNFDAALAFVDASSPEDSMLLHKPLFPEAGGWYHGAAALYDPGNVWRSTQEPDYQRLVAWVGGATAPADCVEPGSDQ